MIVLAPVHGLCLSLCAVYVPCHGGEDRGVGLAGDGILEDHQHEAQQTEQHQREKHLIIPTIKDPRPDRPQSDHITVRRRNQPDGPPLPGMI